MDDYLLRNKSWLNRSMLSNVPCKQNYLLFYFKILIQFYRTFIYYKNVLFSQERLDYLNVKIYKKYYDQCHFSSLEKTV